MEHLFDIIFDILKKKIGQDITFFAHKSSQKQNELNLMK